MAKNLDWQDYSTTYEDSDGDKQTSTVRAAVVDKDNVGREVRDNLGKPVTLKGKEVVVDFGDPDRYNVFTADQWKETGYTRESASSAKTTSGSSGKTTTGGKPNTLGS